MGVGQVQRARSFLWISHRGEEAESFGVLYCFARHINGKLDQKWSSSDSNEPVQRTGITYSSLSSYDTTQDPSSSLDNFFLFDSYFVWSINLIILLITIHILSFPSFAFRICVFCSLEDSTWLILLKSIQPFGVFSL